MRLLSLLLVLPTVAAAQQAAAPVHYDISFANAAHHEAEITAEFRGVPVGPLALRMSRSSPGRYALHEFAKNVYAVRAVDSKGKVLAVTHANPHEWRVAGHDGTVKVTYTLFGDRIDGTYAGISEAHAHLNIPATFMWARGFDQRPVSVTFHPRAGWTIATQLVPTKDSLTFTAPHLQYFMDSPTMLAPLLWKSWPVTSQGKSYTFRVALHHEGTAADAESYFAGAQKIVHEAEGVFGELPAYDFGTYTFVAAYLPYASGDGMEHRNSTSVTGSGSANARALGTVAHEFFHSWNVERLRPKSIEPFDFTEANMSQELWFAEGFTQYYGQLIAERAGITPADQFVRSIGRSANEIVTSPARKWFSAVGMSEQAPFTDAAVSIDPQNKDNTFISYYTYGAAIALHLDLALRARNDTLSLDTFMRAMWNQYGKFQKNYNPEKPYRVDDARRVLGQVAGDTAWARDFFARYVTGTATPDYAPLAARAGVIVRKARAGKAWIGDISWRAQNGAITVGNRVEQETPAYTSGLEMGDRLTQLAGLPITAATQIDSILNAHKPGDVIPVVFDSRIGTKRATLTLGESPATEWMFDDKATPAQLAFRQRWLASTRKD